MVSSRSSDVELIPVEVVYASETSHKLLSLSVPANSTIKEAIKLSGILIAYPELIDLYENNSLKVGVFSRFRELADQLKPNDRIEIYRELIIDPKDARRKRAKG